MAPAPYATEALALIVQEWGSLGTDVPDPAVAPNPDLDVVTDRLTALLLVRLVAVVAPLGSYPDLSITSICRNVLLKEKGWPAPINDQVVGQLREFVHRMIKGYKAVPYHNHEHCYHVVLSACKLLDLFLLVDGTKTTNGHKRGGPPCYGLRNDPLLLLALAFAALIHDVEHQGIPNRQLSQEKDRLAVLYNDQSIAENWSLYVAFSELLQDDFTALRSAMFLTEDVYLRFRKHVINLVLSTDIASPERTQIGKSKWKEAFGDPFETVERKMRAELRRASIGVTGNAIQFRNRRGSTHSELSFEGDGAGEEDSLSGTPEHSERELDASGSLQYASPLGKGTLHSTSNHQSSSGATTSYTRRASTTSAAHERRMSAVSRTSGSSRYRYRLGILRTVDLSGETLETYSRGSIGHATAVSSDHAYSVELESDEPDELRATVVLETLMTAADVGHNLQGWEQMIKWSRYV